MKLVTFIQNNTQRLGALVERNGSEVVVDLQQADPSLPDSVMALLQGGDALLDAARAALEKAPDANALSAVKLAAPLTNPGKIICIGLNYSDHAAETGQPIPDYPVVFAKYNNTIVGPGADIVLPKVSQQVDYEAELGFVIGKRCRYVSEADALSYVAGYLAINDVSARDYQNRTSQWSMGKTFDTFAPMGPALVTRDEVPDPHNLSIRLLIGNEVLQDSNTNKLIFNIPQLVAALSEVMTLEPGDVVSTGTPPGVGAARKPPRFLKAGDMVHVEIEKLGTLSNPVVAER